MNGTKDKWEKNRNSEYRNLKPNRNGKIENRNRIEMGKSKIETSNVEIESKEKNRKSKPQRSE